MNDGEEGMKIPGDVAAAPADPVADPGAFGPAPAASGPVNPAALTIAQVVRMLGVTEQIVRDHIAAGAPTGVGETVNLVHYAAWLNRQLKDRDAD